MARHIRRSRWAPRCLPTQGAKRSEMGHHWIPRRSHGVAGGVKGRATPAPCQPKVIPRSGGITLCAGIRSHPMFPFDSPHQILIQISPKNTPTASIFLGFSSRANEPSSQQNSSPNQRLKTYDDPHILLHSSSSKFSSMIRSNLLLLQPFKIPVDLIFVAVFLTSISTF